MSISPLAPKSFLPLPPIEGVRLASIEAGIKAKGRKDLCVLVFDEPTRVAGVFTRSACPSAAVDWCRTQLPGGTARAVVINAGNANAFTGQRGADATRLTAEAAASAVGCAASEIFVASTGVIGEPLDAEAFAPLLSTLCAEADADRWREAAEAIRTTDTYAKTATTTVSLGDRRVTINGIAKGSGMIAPDMATMLSFIVTDAPIAAPILQALLEESTATSFNSITVDSDTSTSDTVLLFSAGKARDDELIRDTSDPRLAELRRALASLMQDLALQIIRDGEGATKLIEIHVSGAASAASARKIALSIANSPLVKTAVAGEDANWGRVVMAVGKAGEPADRDRLAIWFGDLRVAVAGERDPDYSEEEASRVMKNEEILVRVDVGIGDGESRVWTCDLTHGYISINADYRT